MKRFKITGICAIMSLALIMSVTGCTSGTENHNVKDDGTASGGQTQEPATQELTYDQYFANDEYIALGDENLDHYIPVETTITIPPTQSEEETMLAVLESLKTVPESTTDGAVTITEGAITTTVGKKYVFDSVKMNGTTAEINLLNTDELTGGDLEERLSIGQIVMTLVNAFDGVDNVQFLADGEPVETLMGHIDTSKPIGLSDL